MFKRKSNRLSKFDYSTPGYYFITICSAKRFEYFGEMLTRKMALNPIGQAAERFWKEIPKHYSGASLDEYIVMPNHLHGIIIIPEMQANGLRYNLSKIVGSYKNVVSKYAHTQGFKNFSWQASFYDHVIRKDESLDKIREYIRNNPLKWELDKNNPENIWM